jgi:hypothetical protein
MTLTAESAPLLAALETASSACSSKMPILSCANIAARADGTITISCDSLDQRLEVTIDGAEVESSFSFVASPRMLRASLRAERAILTLKDGKLHVDSGGKSSIFTLDPKEFPAPWVAITVKPVESGFLSSLKHVIACANPDAADIMNAAHWRHEARHLVSVGRGNSSLCIHPLALGISRDFSIPGPCAKTIGSVFTGGESFALGHEAGIVHIHEGNIKGWFKTMEARVPNHAVLIIKDAPFASMERESLLRALESLEAFSDAESGNWATLKSDDGEWSVLALNREGESLVPVVEVEHISDVDSMILPRDKVTKFLRGLTADRVEMRRDERAMQITPCDESGVMGIFGMRRPD